MKAPRSSGLPAVSLWVTAAVAGWWGLLVSGWRHLQVERQWTTAFPYLVAALGVPLLFAGVAWLYGWSLRLVRHGPPRLRLKGLLPALLASSLPLALLSFAIPGAVSNTENPPFILLGVLLVAGPSLGLAAAGWWSGRAGLFQAAIAVWGLASTALGLFLVVLLFRAPKAEGWAALGPALGFLAGIAF